MANIRRLKKNLNYLTNELVSECLTYQYFNKDVDNQKVNKILSDILNNHNELIGRINNCKIKNDPKKVKEYYKEIISDFKKSIDCLDNLAAK
jgi:hypothetical protein